MLDINLLRRDLPGVIAQLERRKNPQPYLDVARFTALEAERKQIQVATEQLQARRRRVQRPEVGEDLLVGRERAVGARREAERRLWWGEDAGGR